MDWNLSQWAAFRAVAESESFTRGAEAIGVSQPAVSKQVAALERSLGVALIERGTRGARPTHAGEILLSHARQIDDTLAAARAAVADLTALRRGRLRVGATPTIGTYLLPRALVYFRSRFPDVEVTADVRPGDDLARRLAAGRLDVALTATRAAGAYAFLRDPVAVVVAAAHPLAKRRRLTLADLAGQRLILRDGPRQSPGLAERLLRARRCVPAAPLRLPTTEAVRQATLAGLGVGLLPGIATADDAATGRLRVLAVERFVPTRTYYWLERALTKRPSPVRAFECVLKHAVRGSLPPARRA